jgi:hypothetical protein
MVDAGDSTSYPYGHVAVSRFRFRLLVRRASSSWISWARSGSRSGAARSDRSISRPEGYPMRFRLRAASNLTDRSGSVRAVCSRGVTARGSRVFGKAKAATCLRLGDGWVSRGSKTGSTSCCLSEPIAKTAALLTNSSSSFVSWMSASRTPLPRRRPSANAAASRTWASGSAVARTSAGTARRLRLHLSQSTAHRRSFGSSDARASSSSLALGRTCCLLRSCGGTGQSIPPDTYRAASRSRGG